jgi:hypothetical protein
VHPSIRPHFRADPLRDRHRLSDRHHLVEWVRKNAVLARYAELSAQEDREIAAGHYPQTRTGNRGPRLYPPNATVEQQRMAVGTDFYFDEASIGEDTVQDYLHACRCVDATEARKLAELHAAIEEKDARANTCPVCQKRYPNQAGAVRIREVAGRRIRCCPADVFGLEALYDASDAAEQTGQGRSRAELHQAYVDTHPHGDPQ